MALLALLLTFRMVGAWQGWMNFSPLPALFLFSMAFSRGSSRWLLPTAAWLISDLLLNVWYQQSMMVWDQLGLVLGVAATFSLVPLLRRSTTVLNSLLCSVLAALIFYFITNTLSFFSLPQFYPQTWQGFAQAQWTGPIGLGPTWVFLRNACAANMLFGMIFLLVLRPLSPYQLVRNQASA